MTKLMVAKYTNIVMWASQSHWLGCGNILSSTKEVLLQLLYVWVNSSFINKTTEQWNSWQRKPTAYIETVQNQVAYNTNTILILYIIHNLWQHNHHCCSLVERLSWALTAGLDQLDRHWLGLNDRVFQTSHSVCHFPERSPATPAHEY